MRLTKVDLSIKEISSSQPVEVRETNIKRDDKIVQFSKRFFNINMIY